MKFILRLGTFSKSSKAWGRNEMVRKTHPTGKLFGAGDWEPEKSDSGISFTAFGITTGAVFNRLIVAVAEVAFC